MICVFRLAFLVVLVVDWGRDFDSLAQFLHLRQIEYGFRATSRIIWLSACSFNFGGRFAMEVFDSLRIRIAKFNRQIEFSGNFGRLLLADVNITAW